jgi:hypothetical protein
MIARLKGLSDRWLGFIFGLGTSFIVLSFLGDNLFHDIIWGLGCLLVLAFIGLVLLKRKEKKV